ncbi:MAG TPA: DNA ligase D [Candidatus Sulfotelmatobacter sp.]|nr:DNA ligase D [Candidatus Sulfotelmatobacter sp.]
MLNEYRKKRDFKKTAEPAGDERHQGGDRAFVVQKHAATHLHYDLRLEVDGVLKSWAVPKGPSLNPGDKRLAMQVEDHPFEYRKFEGSIPKGEYGGGEVIIWDQGTYSPEGALSTKEQLAKGELKFQLHGEKLRGSFVLVKLRKPGNKNEWLLIKHRDAFADSKWDADQHAESVVSGRTLEDIAEGRPASRERRAADPSVLPGAMESPMPNMPSGVRATLAELGDKPFSSANWVYEIKWDGVRAIAQIEDGKATLWARSGRDVTSEYPEFKDMAARFRARRAIVDGEIVTLDKDGRSNFHTLQRRLGVQNPSRQLMQSVPLDYFAFDVIYADGFDLRRVPLVERKDFLQLILSGNERIHFSEHIAEQGEALYEAARSKGLEGIIAKLANSTYAGARTSTWVKLKIVDEVDAVIAGYTEGRGSRKFFGALVLGLYEGRELKFIGSVGTGFDEGKQEEIFEQLKQLRTEKSPFAKAPALRENVDWIEPELVARVKYANWTNDNHLRAPVFLSLLTDRAAKDCTMEDAKPESTAALETKAEKENPTAKKAKAQRAPKEEPGQRDSDEESQAPEIEEEAVSESSRAHKNPPQAKNSGAKTTAKTISISSGREAEIENELRSGSKETMDVESDGQRLHFSNLNKIYFPDVGVKKRELLAYYYRMARYILPFLQDRPMVLRRYPDGVDGKAFFQKEAPSYLPDWIETATVDSEERGGEMQYILCNSRATLLYLTNLGCIDHNPWSSRAQSQQNPDYVFFDLDPTPDTPFPDVMHIAREIYAMLKSIKMRCYMKTSGASGFHIFIPLEPKYTFEQTRTFAEVVGRLVASENSKLTTFERTVSKRPKGRILIDALQNASGKPLACAYSVRAFPKATVSTPLTPEELTTNISAEQFTLRNFNERIAKVGDLWTDFWKNRQTLDRALELLAKKFPKGEL